MFVHIFNSYCIVYLGSTNDVQYSTTVLKSQGLSQLIAFQNFVDISNLYDVVNLNALELSRFLQYDLEGKIQPDGAMSYQEACSMEMRKWRCTETNKPGGGKSKIAQLKGGQK